LSASGLRSLRYAREVDGIGQVVAVDNDQGASRFFSLYVLVVYFMVLNVESSAFVWFVCSLGIYN